jgi:type II secretory pathway pseudopilin PulG
MKSQNNRGFILIMTLCIVAIISMLLLTCMQHLLLYSNAINKQELFQHEFYQLEQLALQLIKGPLDSQCLSFQDAANQSFERVKAHNACFLSLGKNSYYYLIEDMGVLPCWMIHKKSWNYSAQRLRLSVLKDSNVEYNSPLLQIGLFKAVSLVPCFEQEHSVPEGVISWRYVHD